MVKDSFGRDWSLDDMAMCVGPGWKPLIERLYKLCELEEVSVTQVKEKYGGLCFYVGPAPDRVLDIIEGTEDESQTICEECGAPGINTKIKGWWHTVCERHAYPEQGEIKTIKPKDS